MCSAFPLWPFLSPSPFGIVKWGNDYSLMTWGGRMTGRVGNQMQWTGTPGWYEVWFLTTTHRPSGAGFWIRYTLTAPTPALGSRPYCQLWFASFEGEGGVAANSQFPIQALRVTEKPFRISLGDAFLEDGRLVGSLDAQGHRAAWDLTFQPEEHVVRPLPDWAYSPYVPGTKFLCPNFSVPLYGRISVDGQVFLFKGERGTQCHIFGTKHSTAWAWGHVAGFDDDEETAVDVLSARLGPVTRPLPSVTLVTLRRHGRIYAFHNVLSLLGARSSWAGGRLTFTTGSPFLRVFGEFRADPRRMVRATYSDPDGDKAFCHNTETAAATLVIEKRGLASGWDEAARLVAEGCAHVEYASRSPDPTVIREHRPVEGAHVEAT